MQMTIGLLYRQALTDQWVELHHVAELHGSLRQVEAKRPGEELPAVFPRSVFVDLNDRVARSKVLVGLPEMPPLQVALPNSVHVIVEIKLQLSLRRACHFQMKN